MPKNEQEFDVEKLKTDPQMWMRLAMSLDDSNALENVFKGKENPFDKDGKAAMETVQKLASEGKLYLRDKGRSKHFHKVEQEGNQLKLGDPHEMKLSNRMTDPVLGTLMWMSRGYFKWLGLDSISNWFDKRVKRRAEIKELGNRYKEEFKSLSKEEKKILKAVRKHEKNLKKLEKAKKEAEKTQQEIDKIRGKDTADTKGEMDSPLSQPPEVEQEKNTMQPTLMGDQPVQEKEPIQSAGGPKLVQQQTTQHEIRGEKKEASRKNEKSNQIIIEGEVLTEENINKFPPHVVEAFKLIQQLINEKEGKEKTNQQPIQDRPAEEKEALKQDENEIKQAEQIPAKDNSEPELNVPNESGQPMAEGEPLRKEINSPLKEGINPEPELVSMQGRPKEQEQPTLQERLAAEKDAMDSVSNWKEHLANAVFSGEGDNVARDYYQMLNEGNEASGAEFLSGTVFGILTGNSGSPERKQQVIDALLNGKPLGSENEDLINNGVAAYNDAIARNTSGNPERLANMVADTMRELSHQAGRETTLSPRLVLIGRLLSNAAKLANENGLELPLDEDEMNVVRGAATLSDVAQKYHNARQFLGNEPMDMKSTDGRKAVRDLLMGNAVEKMLQQDKRLGQTITNTQQIMGEGLWALKNLRVLTSDTATRRGIKAEDIHTILEKPNSTKALGIGRKTVNEIVQASMEVYTEAERAVQKEAELGDQENQPEIDPLNLPG